MNLQVRRLTLLSSFQISYNYWTGYSILIRHHPASSMYDSYNTKLVLWNNTFIKQLMLLFHSKHSDVNGLFLSSLIWLQVAFGNTFCNILHRSLLPRSYESYSTYCWQYKPGINHAYESARVCSIHCCCYLKRKKWM